MALEFAALSVRIGANIGELSQKLNSASGKVNRFATRGAQSMKSMAMGMQELGTKMLFVGAAATGMTALAVKEFATFEKGLADIAILLGKDKSAMEGIEDTIVDVARTTGTATDDLARGFFDVQSAVGDTTKSLDIFKAANDLAIAGGAEFGETSRGLVTLMEAYGDSLEGAADGADLMFKTQVFARASISELATATGQFLPMASDLQISVEDAMAAFSKMTVSIGNTSEASTAMTGVLRSLLKPTDELQEKMQEWFGMTAQQAVAQGKFLDIMERLGEVEKEEIGRLVPNIRGLKGLLAVSKDINDVKEKSIALTERSGIVDQEKTTQMETMARATKIAKENFDALIREAVRPLIPLIDKLARDVIPAITKSISEWFEANEELIKEALEPLAAQIQAFATETVPAMVKSMKEWAKENEVLIQKIIRFGTVFGPVLLILGSLAMILSPILYMFASLVGIVGKVAFVIGKLTPILASVGPLIAGISATTLAMVAALAYLAITLGQTIQLFMEMKQAEEDLQERQEQAASSTEKYAEKLAEAYDKIVGSYKDLSDEEIQAIADQKQRIELFKEKARVMHEDGKLTEEETKAIGLETDELQENWRMISSAIQARGNLTEAKKTEVEEFKKGTGEQVDAEGKLITSIDGVTDAVVFSNMTQREEIARTNLMVKEAIQIMEQYKKVAAASKRSYEASQEVQTSGDESVRRFQRGTEYVMSTGTALIHRGEKIIPAHVASGVGSEAPQITLVVGLEPDLVNSMIDPNAIINIVGKDIVNRGPLSTVIRTKNQV